MVAATPLIALLIAGAEPVVPAVDPAPPAVVAAPVAGDPVKPAPAEPAPPPPAPVPAAKPTGEILVNARQGPPPGDPVEKVNETSFKAVSAVDNAVVGPVAMTYKKVLPSPARDGIRHALRNLTEPVNFVNYLLQLKPGKAFETLGRFTLNSTLGIGGLIDVAAKKPFNLPYRVNGFANTMGYYGIGPGPYLYLPLIGPTTLRDVTGRILDLSMLPMAVGKPFKGRVYSLGNGVLKSLDDRIEMDDLFRKLREDCPDAYTAEREWYLANRKAQIEALHGRGTGQPDLPECLTPAWNQVPPPVPLAQPPAPEPATPEQAPPASPPAVPAPQPAPAAQPAVTATM